MNNVTLVKNKLMDMTSILSSEEEGKVEILNPFTQKRLKIKKNYMLEVIHQIETGSLNTEIKNELEKFELIKENGVNPQSEALINHWKKRNWSFSLDYYNWTRDIEYEDTGINYNDKRKETLDLYINEEGLPPEPRVLDTTKETVYLSKKFNVEKTQLSFGEVLLRRSTVEQFSLQSIPFINFSKIMLEAFEGLKLEREKVSSSTDTIDLLKGLGYPFDFFVAIFNVEGIRPGVYFYDVKLHALELIKTGEFRKEVQEILIGQSSPETSAFTLFISVNYSRKQWRYRHERELRNTYLNSAQICQRFLLTATYNNLFCNLTPANRDRKMADLLELNDLEEQILYTVNAGFSAGVK